MNSNQPKAVSHGHAPAPAPQNPDREIPATWREFRAGMKVLQRYAAHNTADSHAIAKDNLRLLHRSLLQDANYRQTLKALRRETAGTETPILQGLPAPAELQAGLVNIPANGAIHLHTRPHHMGMFIILSGTANIFDRTQVPSPARHGNWRMRLRSGWFIGWQQAFRNLRQRQLKANDVIIVSHCESHTPTLFAGKKNCVLLNVLLPLQTAE